MKRRNHVVLGSITVLASVGLAGLFIFPASGEGEQHYNCNLQDGKCSLVEEGVGEYTCTKSDWGEWIRCTSGPQQLNFCEYQDGSGENIICNHSFTRSEENVNGGYYFTQDPQNYSGNSYCEYPDSNVVESLTAQSESMIICNYYGDTTERYNSCRIDDNGSTFCLANYKCTEDEGGYQCTENNSGEFRCEVKESGSGEKSLTALKQSDEYICYKNGEYEQAKECFLDEQGSFICPTEYRCIAGPGGEYCKEYNQGGFYCVDRGSSYKETKGENRINNSYCFPTNGGKGYENCEYLDIEGGVYFCPLAYECNSVNDRGHYCEQSDDGEYSCRIVYSNMGSQLQDEGLMKIQMGTMPMETIVCADGENQLTNCQISNEFYEDSQAGEVTASEGPSMEAIPLFCPADKYNCHSENGFMICDPSTTGNYSCSFPQSTTEKAEAEHVLSKSAQSEYAVCTNGSGESYTDCQYYSEGFNDRLVDSAYVNGGYPSIGYYICPMKYSCDEIKNGKHVCSLDNTKGDFYCRESYGGGGKSLKASELIMGDYTCAQQNGKRYDNCISAEGNFYCDVRYSCTPVKGGYQCKIDDENGEYKCKQPTVFLDTTSSNYTCSGPNTYNNCEPNEEGYFCPVSVELKLYLGGCVNTNTPTAAVVDATIECDGEGYLGTVLVSKDSGVSADTLFNGVNNLPNPEVGMEWVWYLGNSQDADKLSESTQFSVDSKLYVFQDKRKIGTIRFDSDLGTDVPSVTGYYNTTIQLPSPTRTGYNFAGWYDGNNKVSISYLIQGDKILKAHWTENKPSGGYSGGGGSSRGTSKGSGPSSSDVKSVEKGPDTQTKNEPKPEVKPVVKPVNNGGTHGASTGKVSPAQELADAYKWAYANGLTKYANMSDARLDDYLNRQEMAKISTIFATKFHGETPNEAKRKDCSQYPDLWKTTSDMQEFIKQSCELGYMGYRANGVDYLERFRPYTPVSVAEVSIILSRIMWKNKYAISENKWYQGHLHAVYENQLLDDITKPFDYITRRDAYIMLYRLSGKL